MKNIILSGLISIWNIFRLPYGNMTDLTAEHICLKKYIFYHVKDITVVDERMAAVQKPLATFLCKGCLYVNMAETHYAPA